MMTLQRSTQAGHSSTIRLYDVTNAFYCVRHDDVTEWLQPLNPQPHLPESWYHSILDQTLTNSVCIVPTADTPALLIHPQTGVLPGLTCATKTFNTTYQKAIIPFSEETHNPMLTATPPPPVHPPTPINTAITTFVDDVAAQSITRHPSHPHLATKHLITTFDKHLDAIGFSQTPAKDKPSSNHRQRNKTSTPHSLQRHHHQCHTHQARYLGPHLHRNATTAHEVERRTQAAWQAWCIHKNCGHRRCTSNIESCASRHLWSQFSPVGSANSSYPQQTSLHSTRPTIP